MCDCDKRKAAYGDERTFNYIRNYFEAPRSETNTEGALAKLGPTKKENLAKLCHHIGVGQSSFIRDAIEVHMQFFPYKEKLLNNIETIAPLLDKLP